MLAKKPRRPTISEKQIHIQVANYFRDYGLGGVAIAAHIRNENARASERIASVRMGILRGCPDWMILDSARAGFIELKKPGFKAKLAKGNKLNQHELRQLDVHKRLKLAGCWVAICESLDEVKQALAEHGVPLNDEPLIVQKIRAGFARAMAESAEQ